MENTELITTLGSGDREREPRRSAVNFVARFVQH